MAPLQRSPTGRSMNGLICYIFTERNLDHPFFFNFDRPDFSLQIYNRSGHSLVDMYEICKEISIKKSDPTIGEATWIGSIVNGFHISFLGLN